MAEQGKPEVKFLNTKSLEFTNAERFKEATKVAFRTISMNDLSPSLKVLNAKVLLL